MNDSKKGAICQTPNIFCVYVIWCSLTDKFYVGVTYQKVQRRIKQHRRGKQFIDREIQRIGWEHGDWWVVEKNISAEKIDEREKYWIEFFDSVYPNGYNRTHSGIGKISVSEETLALISKRARERDMSGENNPMYGRHHTDETKAIISAKMSGENGSMYGKSPANKGVPHTAEAKAKMSESHKGEKNHFYGRHHTEESKEKNRQVHLGQIPWNKGKKLVTVFKENSTVNEETVESAIMDRLISLKFTHMVEAKVVAGLQNAQMLGNGK